MRVMLFLAVTVFSVSLSLTACGGGETTCGTKDVSFKNCVVPILNKSCGTAGCHAADNPKGKLDLSQNHHANIVNKESEKRAGKKQVVPSKPDESLLYLKLLADGKRPADVGGKMPPAKLLEQAQVDTIKAWISEGAKNN